MRTDGTKSDEKMIYDHKVVDEGDSESKTKVQERRDRRKKNRNQMEEEFPSQYNTMIEASTYMQNQIVNE